MKRLIVLFALIILLAVVGRGLAVAYEFFIEMRQIEDRACFINEEIPDV